MKVGARRSVWGVLIAAALLAAVSVVRVSRGALASLHPARVSVAAPVGLGGVTSAAFVTDDGILIRGWYVPSRNHATVILGHGWGGQRGKLLPEARVLAAHGYGILAFDWRGHGESGGDGTTWGIEEQRDLAAALNFVTRRPEVDSTRIGALGFSMGGMIMLKAAENDPRLRAVVVEGAYTSLEDEVRHDHGRWGWWSGTVSAWTLRLAGVRLDRERPIDALCRISPRPLLIIGSTADRDLPEEISRRMYAAACQPKELWMIEGATHMTYHERGGAALDRRLVKFFDDALTPSTNDVTTGASAPAQSPGPAQPGGIGRPSASVR
jgi:dipeptidyl aminopeptidase/acylaminoacyl peptidase